MKTISEKTISLLEFLKEIAILRQKRISAYRNGDKLLWLADLPRDLPQSWLNACRSAFTADTPDEIPDLWLEVRKKRKPEFPTLPKELQDWIPQEFQRNPDAYVHKKTDELLDLLNPQITVLVEKQVSDPNGPGGERHTLTETVSEEQRLEDHPEVEDAWLDYLENRWEPWAQEMRLWQEIQDLYEKVDFMRRRIEEAEERYELLMAVGLLQWRDSTGTTVKRHLLTAPAEISLDAGRGVLGVGPAASFESFRVELDMLELQDRPHLEETDLESMLENLDVRAWDKKSVGEILRIIANKARSDNEVDEEAWTPLDRANETFRVLYAPALVLRERRPKAYEEMINKFVEATKTEPTFQITEPWNRFVSEGELSNDPANGGSSVNSGLIGAADRLYFPLRMNDEQRRIAESLRRRPYVLVKGPPGTGKSHTIANLICHLLATGERVLVTAHAPKALTVLQDLLPSEIRNLCVTALGSTREDHRLLEDNVRGILARKNEWKGEEWAKAEIERLEKELYRLEDEHAKVDRELRQWREAETYSHTLPGGYQGTAARIAIQLESEREAYGWFPELPDDENRCPLEPKDITFLAEVHPTLTEEQLNELGRDIGTFSLPEPREFAEVIEQINDAEGEAQAARLELADQQLSALSSFSDQDLAECREFLDKLEEQTTRATRALGRLTDEILKDLLAGQDARWDEFQREVDDLCKSINEARERAGTDKDKIDIPPDVEEEKMLADAQRRLEHFRKGGWRGWGPFAPRVVRETRYIEKQCRVNGEAPRDQKLLDTLCGYIELRVLLRRFDEVWPETTGLNPDANPRHAAREVVVLVEALSQLLELFKSSDQKGLHILPIDERVTLAARNERTMWRRLIDAELAYRFAHQARQPLEEWRELIRGLANDSVHPCMADLAQAIEDRDPEKWGEAWTTRKRLRAEKDRVQQYQELLDKIRQACPKVAEMLESNQGNPAWEDRVRKLQQAWDWAAAKAWLRKVTSPEIYERLADKSRRLQDKIQKKLEELAALKAWQAFFLRIDDQTEQNLTAWTKAVARIGKGTGKYAYRHRRTARQYLRACIPKMPAWIMPLHKLWETVDPTPGLFDTVIIDEASQAGIEALALLLLAKRIIVVGDDKQNSPEGVGVLEDDIARLTRDHLQEFLFSDEFRPDTSLYDHAERAFGNLISLREHFRCVPEIIRFSNDLCYTDAPLIPLRQPPPNRLPPLRAVYVKQGSCEGDGARITNRAEAEKVVETVQMCLNDEAYEGKTMGIIVLQGRAQAELIEKMLAEKLEPKIREDRKLRCGVPATFQGDQRDVIFLSLVVAPNHNFRALTGLPDQRRFNVAMSRARDQVLLFHSVQLDDLRKDDLRWRLVNFFYKPGSIEAHYEELDRLEYEAKRSLRQHGEQPPPYESWFEVDVALEILRRKYRLRPQVTVAGYRIDLVVEGLDNRLAVECDGEAWHGPERFDYDRARQRQLERAGWTFVRIRESEFYTDRDSALRRIIDACDALGIRPIAEECDTDEESRATVPSAEGLFPEGDEDQEGEERGDVEEESSKISETLF